MNKLTKEQDKGLKANSKMARMLPYFICLLAAMFYLYEFVLQVSPAVMTHELMHDLGLNAATLSGMAAFYYYAYTPMQIPAGLLYDRFGPRKLIPIAILICAAGAFFFGLTDSTMMASAGRFFMGVGSAFSFIGALVLISRWFPPTYFAVLAGLVQFMSSVGAIAGQAPLARLVSHYGWRNTILNTAIIGVGLALLVWLIVRDSPEQVKGGKKPASDGLNEFKRLALVCKNKQTWLVGLYSFGVWGPITVFAALWGIPYLAECYGLNTEQASWASAMIWLGIGIGSPLLGWWSDLVKRRCLPLTAASLSGLVATMAVLYLHLSMPMLLTALFVFGFGAGGQSLAFGLVKDNNRHNVVGTAIGFNNMAVVAGGALLQPLAGVLLQLHWNGVMQHGVPYYTVSNYRFALTMLPVCYLASAIISTLFLRETYCKENFQEEQNPNNQLIVPAATQFE